MPHRINVPVTLAAYVILAVSSPFARPDTTVWLSYDRPETLPAGSAVRLEVRADLDRALTAIRFDVRSTGDAPASLTGRSADFRSENGLVYISAVNQTVPFVSGLPHDLSSAPAREVLLHIGEPPFDSVPPEDDLVVGWIEVTPAQAGELTIEIANVQAASTQWHPDGVLLDAIAIDESRAAVSLTVVSSFFPDSDGDGDVDMHDLAAFQVCFSGPDAAPDGAACASFFDSDEDGDVDPDDLGAFLSALTGPAHAAAADVAMDANPAGRGGADPQAIANADTDGNGEVDDADLVLVRQRLGTSDPENEAADVNADGVVDLLDLIYVRNRIGRAAPGERSYSPDLRITELDFSGGAGAPWVELTHVGTGILEILPFYISNEKGGFNYIFSNLPSSIRDVPPGFRLVISFDGPAPLTWLGNRENRTGAIAHVGPPVQMPDPEEDALRLLVQDGRGGGWVAQRVAWGGVEQTDPVINPRATPVPPGGSIGADAYEPDLWHVHSTSTPGRPNELEPPAPYFPFEGLEVEESDPLRLVWTDIRYGLLQYRVQVAGAAGFDAPVVDSLAEGTLHDLTPLPAGDYAWRVRIEAGAWESDWSEVATFTVLPASGNGQGGGAGPGAVTLEWFLQNPLPAPEKDTKLLCLDCKHSKGPHAWDAIHKEPDHQCPHGMLYGTFAVIAAVNHFYGGTVRLDQLSEKLALCKQSTAPCIKTIGHETGYVRGPAEAMALLEWALGLEQGLHETVSLKAADSNSIANVLRDGRPVLAWRSQQTDFGESVCGGDPMLVYGYLPASGTRPERVQALDPRLGTKKTNFIIAFTFPLSRIACAQTAADPPLPEHARPVEEDPRMKRDTDGDGITDYDEEERLVTQHDTPDSDSDGLDDKIEIFSYSFGKGRIKRQPDIDGDGLRAEVDLDGDNDGCPDGEEDKNHNGHYLSTFSVVSSLAYDQWMSIQLDPLERESGESDPFFKDLYELRLKPGRTQVAAGKSVSIEVELTYVDNSEKKQGKKGAKIELLVADERDRGDLADSEVTTDENGRARTTFLPKGEILGDVELKAIYRPCENAVRTSEAIVLLKIVEVDWMFTIQDEARLTRTEVLKRNPIESSPGRVMRFDWRTKHAGYQRLVGSFSHPDLEKPGLYIDTIYVSPPSEWMTLRVNDVVAPDLTWRRSNEDEEPKTWRIDVADEDFLPDGADGFRLPRFLVVSGAGFNVRTPLLTWTICFSHGTQVRDYTPGFKVLSRDYSGQSASVHFGDGDAGGYDRGPLQWPDELHTSVSFIPFGDVAGYGPGHYESSGWWPVDWTTASGDAASTTDVFGTGKNDVQITPPFTWSVTQLGATSADALAAALRRDIERAGRVEPPPLIEELVFERDYLKAELDELEKRGLTPLRYFITLRSR